MHIPEPVYAWGPGMHYYLADQLLRVGMLTGAIESLVQNHKKWFFYGSIIADVVIGKRFISYDKHSHNWSLAKDLRSRANTDDEEVFALGVWTHLAADTVAHNEFVPDKIEEVNFSEDFGHAYWEFRADRWVSESCWERLEELIQRDFTPHEEMLEETIRDTVLPFPVNWAVLKSHLKISTWKSWRRLADFYANRSQHDLTDEDMEPYCELCLNRMAQSLQEGPERDQILSLDPTGDFPEHHS